MNYRRIPPLQDLLYNLDKLVRTHLWAQIFVGMVLGVGVGVVFGPTLGVLNPDTANNVGHWLALPGKLFLALIQAVVIPLVLSSIIMGLNSSDDISAIKHIGFRAIPFFILTTVLACVIGIGVASIVEPGNYVDAALVQNVSPVDISTNNDTEHDTADKDLPSHIVSLIPQSFEEAAIQRNMLQIVVFAMLIGAALLLMKDQRSKPLLAFMDSTQAVSMKVVSWAMLLAPYAVFGLLAQVTMQIGLDALLGMSVYVGVVIIGLLCLLAVYLLLLMLIAGFSPFSFLSKARNVMLLAFSTSSSAAVMPLSIETAEKNGINPAISQFIIPLGATVNMAGTALYQVVAAVFLIQVYEVEVSSAAMITLIVTTVGASIGSPASPGVGIVILATILATVNVPASGIALIIGVDRILDMCRTAVNVTGDLVACVVTQHWLKDSLPPTLEELRSLDRT